jgi:hypothetical protein
MNEIVRNLNIIENELNIDRTRATHLLPHESIEQRRNIFYVQGSWYWISMPQTLSLLTLLIRLSFISNVLSEFSCIDDFKCIVKNVFDNKSAYSEAINRLLNHGHLWPLFLRNHYLLLDQRSSTQVYKESSYRDGITSLMLGYGDNETVRRWMKIKGKE